MTKLEIELSERFPLSPREVKDLADFIEADRLRIGKNLYDEGYKDGMTCFAWHGKNGLEVGTSGRSLEKALEERRENYNYHTFDTSPY